MASEMSSNAKSHSAMDSDMDTLHSEHDLIECEVDYIDVQLIMEGQR